MAQTRQHLVMAAAIGLLALPAWSQPATTPAPAPAPAAAPSEVASPAQVPAQAPDAAGPAVNAKEQQLLERIRQLKAPRWRSYGPCRYDWSSWRLAEGGVRTTEVECGPEAQRAVVAVHCDTLKVSRREGEAAWSPWRLPLALSESKTTGGEDLMVAALCANLKPAAEGSAAPAPQASPASPAATPAKPPAAAKPAPATAAPR